MIKNTFSPLTFLFCLFGGARTEKGLEPSLLTNLGGLSFKTYHWRAGKGVGNRSEVRARSRIWTWLSQQRRYRKWTGNRSDLVVAETNWRHLCFLVFNVNHHLKRKYFHEYCEDLNRERLCVRIEYELLRKGSSGNDVTHILRHHITEIFLKIKARHCYQRTTGG